VSGFEPDERTAELRSRVRAFVDERVIPAEPVLDRHDEQARTRMAELQAAAKEEGLWALGLPEEIGGGGLGFMPYCHVNEVIGRSEHAMVALGTHSAQDATMLHLFATPEQKERWLFALVRGEIYPSIGMTEPDAPGSDPTQVQTTAVLDGPEWVVNGHKWFTTGANVAAFTTVFCVTEPDAASHARCSLIIVPTDTPGYEIVRVIPVMGETEGPHCELRLTDVRVPAENLLGRRGDAFKMAQARLGPGRIYHCMRWLGQAQRAFDLMCERALAREVAGGPLATKQIVQAWIADSAAEIQAARLMTLDAAAKIDAGRDARVEISLIKFFGAKVLHDVIDRAIQVHGALGISGDTPLERMYRHARGARFYDGPDEVHRITVARRLLGEYAEGGAHDFAG
jgi:alkylation response protein AidB-like acyl-CoA dehydrogenase